MHCDFLLTPNSPRRPNHRGDEALTLAPTRSDDRLSCVAINEQFAYQSGDHFLWWSPFLHWGCWLKSFPEQQSVTYLCLRENLLNHLYLVSLPTFTFTRLVVFVQGRTGIGCLWPRLLWFYSSTKKQSDQTQLRALCTAACYTQRAGQHRWMCWQLDRWGGCVKVCLYARVCHTCF